MEIARMTQAEALYQFFSSFDIAAYPAEDVPDNAKFPWLTYELVTGAWGDVAGITVNLWYYSESNVEINAKAKELSSAIGLGGKVVRCDGGAIWIKRGSPWCQSVRDDTDNKIKRRYINITLEYLTAH